MVLCAKELLERTPTPTEAEVREALSGVLCRCTGYKKPVEAILAAAQATPRTRSKTARRGRAAR